MKLTVVWCGLRHKLVYSSVLIRNMELKNIFRENCLGSHHQSDRDSKGCSQTSGVRSTATSPSSQWTKLLRNAWVWNFRPFWKQDYSRKIQTNADTCTTKQSVVHWRCHWLKCKLVMKTFSYQVALFLQFSRCKRESVPIQCNLSCTKYKNFTLNIFYLMSFP